jgi:hypothetical protein
MISASLFCGKKENRNSKPPRVDMRGSDTCLDNLLNLEKLCRNSTEVSFRASPISLPRTWYGVGRDPESRKVTENQIILDPPPVLAGDDELGHNLAGEENYKHAVHIRF